MHDFETSKFSSSSEEVVSCHTWIGWHTNPQNKLSWLCVLTRGIMFCCYATGSFYSHNASVYPQVCKWVLANKKLEVRAFQRASVPSREMWKFSVIFHSTEFRYKHQWMGYHAEIPTAQTFVVTFLQEPWVEKLLNCIVVVKIKTPILFFFTGVLEEAEFYNIDPLVKIIKDRIQSREARQKLPVSFVYVNTLV